MLSLSVLQLIQEPPDARRFWMVTTPDPARPVLVLTVPLYLTLVFTGADDLETLSATFHFSRVTAAIAKVLTTWVVALRAMSWAQYSIVWVPVPVSYTHLTLPTIYSV